MSTTTTIDPKTGVLPLLEGSTWPGADAALDAVHSLPVPTVKTEDWKYTRVGRLFHAPYAAPKGDAAVTLPERLPFPATRVVFVNGHFRSDLSDDLRAQEGVVVDSLARQVGNGLLKAHYGTLAPIGDRLFTAMNTAAPTDGTALVVFKGVKLAQPLHILHLTTAAGQLVQPRDLFLVQEGAEAEVVIERGSLAPDAGTSLVNSVRECFVAQGARLTVHQVQHEAAGPACIAFEGVRVEAGGWFSIDTTTLDSSLVRNDLRVSLAGPEAHAELNGVYVIDGTTHCDNHTYIGHDVPDCTSDELYKGIVAGKATGVFNGKVQVERDAQRTRAYQSNANILQGDDARVFTKPELEIYADDVKCSHGCTIGRLDEKALFYLRSRGVSEAEARRMLAHAFTTDVLERIANEAWRDHLAALIDAKLDAL
ncbi:MAG: Fe-S cluster assembly protein SufD [Bacteroidetes bacterium]|nr:Fe-S cluster assembly protein SufD [Bacteroidota bacterium]